MPARNIVTGQKVTCAKVQRAKELRRDQTEAEINEIAWPSLNSDTSRPFDKPTSGRIVVKVINHPGDEVMKVFRVNGVK